MKASVIIPVWNGREYLPACLDALLAQEYPDFEVIVVDNASVDGSADLVAERYPQVRLIRNVRNLGFAGACNIGIRSAEGDIFVLLNQDTFVENQWITALLAAFTETDAGIVGCKIFSAADRSLQHAGGGIHEILGVPFHFGKNDPCIQNWETPREVDYVTGAAMAIHRSVVERIGLLDERFFPAYYEDVDFCFRARAAGYKVLYWPQAIVFHYESASIPERTRWFYFQRGRIRFVLKHWPLERLINQFAEAETGLQINFVQEFGSTWPLRLAYTVAQLEMPTIAAERGIYDDRELTQIVNLLQQLHMRALMIELAQIYSLYDPGSVTFALTDESFSQSDAQNLVAKLPILREIEFRSTVPVVGGAIALFRRLWYAVAAKWAIRHLISQQHAINQHLVERLERLERQWVVMNRFFLNAVTEAERETVFSLLWPLRWDLVVEPLSILGGDSNG